MVHNVKCTYTILKIDGDHHSQKVAKSFRGHDKPTTWERRSPSIISRWYTHPLTIMEVENGSSEFPLKSQLMLINGQLAYPSAHNLHFSYLTNKSSPASACLQSRGMLPSWHCSNKPPDAIFGGHSKDLLNTCCHGNRLNHHGNRLNHHGNRLNHHHPLIRPAISWGGIWWH